MNIAALAAASAPNADTNRSGRARNLDFAGVLTSAETAASAAQSASPICSPLLLARLVLPTREAVQGLADDLAHDLSTSFAQAGLSDDPPVTFSVDADGDVHVAGDRDDLADIEALVAKDADLTTAIRTTNAAASHAYAIECGGQLEFQRAYRLSADPKEVVAQYANLSGMQHTAAMSLEYGRDGVSVDADGQRWMTTP